MELTPEAREARRVYNREWERKNKDKRTLYKIRYWEKKAKELRVGEATNTGSTDGK